MTSQEIKNYLTSVGYTENIQLQWSLENSDYYLIVNGNFQQLEYFYPDYSAVVMFNFLESNSKIQEWIDFCIEDSHNIEP